MAPPSPSPSLRLACSVALLGLTACGDSLLRWGDAPAAARRNADETAAAFATRFTRVHRDARFAAARPRMGQYALAPSRLFADSSLWTIPLAPDSSRGLYLAAALETDGYWFRSRSAAPYPDALGAQRHYIRLRKLAPSQYEWITIVDHGIGAVPAATLGSAFEALLTSFEGHAGQQLRRDIARRLPTSSRALGKLFRIDSLLSTPLPDGTTTLQLNVRWQPDSMRRELPAFAAWVDKYIMPADFRVALSEPGGTTWLTADGTPGHIRFNLRAHRGNLVALTGPPRPLPDVVQIHADASVKFKIFRVGFRRLVGQLTRERSPTERTLTFRWQREPEWRFPLAVDHLIRAPLRTPFAGRGIEVRLGMRDDLGTQTMSLRHIRLVVHESAIMRWLGGLGATAFGDFEGQSEAEENRFLAEVFEALRRDIAAAIP